MAPSKRSSQARLERSVVKLFATVSPPDYYQPWDLQYQTTLSGSGCILDGRRILTSAHVVADCVYVEALRVGGTRRFVARVVFIDHESELALLEVDDPAFFEGALPAALGDLPRRHDRVEVYGFPIGGDELSITGGLVSRIEIRRYTHSHRALLTVQTDAAINPGNSGGPVFKERKLIGIVFQSYDKSDAENTGYFVPVPIIQHFLADQADGKCSGVPGLGIGWQKMESKSLRAFHGMRGQTTGVLVTDVGHGTSADGVLLPHDVLLSVGGRRIANDGSVALRAGDRVGFSHFVSLPQVGQKLALEWLREGHRMRGSLELKPFRSLVAWPRYDRQPSYFLFAGLLFVPLTHNYLDRWERGDRDPRYLFYAPQYARAARREVVILQSIFPHDINAGYPDFRACIVRSVNGKPVKALADVVRLVNKPQGQWQLFELESDASGATGQRVVLEASGAAEATQAVMKRHSIPRDRSSDLEGSL